MTRAFVFPGQGSQAVGMGKALSEAFPAAKEVFQEVDDALGQNLSKMMFEGPMEDLTLTENTQPALMAASVAVMRVLQSEGGFEIADKAKFIAGHSLGEYSCPCCRWRARLSGYRSAAKAAWASNANRRSSRRRCDGRTTRPRA